MTHRKHTVRDTVSVPVSYLTGVETFRMAEYPSFLSIFSTFPLPSRFFRVLSQSTSNPTPTGPPPPHHGIFHYVLDSRFLFKSQSVCLVPFLSGRVRFSGLFVSGSSFYFPPGELLDFYPSESDRLTCLTLP